MQFGVKWLRARRDWARHCRSISIKLCASVRACWPDWNSLRDFLAPGFFAPEILTDPQYDGFGADTWSAGCVLLNMV